MTPWWWSYLLAGLGVLGLYLAGSGKRLGWVIGIAAQGLWITYAIVTHQYGFIIAALAYAGVYARNWWIWTYGRTTLTITHIDHETRTITLK